MFNRAFGGIEGAAPGMEHAMSDGTAHEVSCPNDKPVAHSAESPRRPNPAAVLQALAALEAEFHSVLNRQGAASS